MSIFICSIYIYIYILSVSVHKLSCMFACVFVGFVCVGGGSFVGGGPLICDFHDCSEETFGPHCYYHRTTTPVGTTIMSSNKINRECGENEKDGNERTAHRNQRIYRIINK